MKTKVQKNGESAVFSTEGEMMAAVAELFPLPAYALLPKVVDATGFARDRTLDALVMSCWPSRGLLLMGIEIKVSRGDWLRELKNPAKAESVCRYCDRFYIAAGESGLVRRDELPPTWGLIEPKGSKLAIKVESPPIEAEAMSRSFLASLLRAASEGFQRGFREAVQKAKWDGQREGREQAAQYDRNELERLKREHETLRASLAQFEQASGLHIHSWGDGPRKLGEAVRFVCSGGLNAVPNEVGRAEVLAQDILRAVESYRSAVAHATTTEAAPDARDV